MKSPAFQFYASDFLVGVTGLSNEEVGIYIKLLCLQWERGELPADPIALRKLVGSRKPVPESVVSKFKIGFRNSIFNERLERVREKQIEFSRRRSENAKSRWSKEHITGEGVPKKERPSDASALQVQCEHDALRTSSLSPSTYTHTPRATDDESEVPDEPQAVAQAVTAGVPEEFAKLVYSEWFEKQGHYRDGLIPFRRRLMGRWSRERAQWEAGTHSSQRKGKPNGQRTEADRERDRTGYEPDSKPLPRL